MSMFNEIHKTTGESNSRLPLCKTTFDCQLALQCAKDRQSLVNLRNSLAINDLSKKIENYSTVKLESQSSGGVISEILINDEIYNKTDKTANSKKSSKPKNKKEKKEKIYQIDFIYFAEQLKIMKSGAVDDETLFMKFKKDLELTKNNGEKLIIAILMVHIGKTIKAETICLDIMKTAPDRKAKEQIAELRTKISLVTRKPETMITFDDAAMTLYKRIAKKANL